MNRQTSMETQTYSICKTDSWLETPVSLWGLKAELRDNLQVWDGLRGGRGGSRRREHVYTCG